MMKLLGLLLLALLGLPGQRVMAKVSADLGSVPPTYTGTRSCNAYPITDKADGISGQATVNDDGSRAVFWSTADYNGGNPDHNLEVYLVALNSTTVLSYTQITSSTGSVLGGFNLSPVISSDGRWVAFFSDRDLVGQNPDGNFEIFLADVSVVMPGVPVPIRQLTQSTIGINIYPSISADGHFIAFASDRDYVGQNADGNSEVFRVELRPGGGTTFVQVTNTGADVNNDFPAISADGRQVAFATNSNAAGSTTSGVYHANGAANGSFAVTQIALFNSQTSNQIAISADGTRVAYASNQANPSSSTTQIFLARVNSRSAQTEQVTTLTNTNGASNSQPGLNADASRMVWVSTLGATSTVMMYEPATGVLERLSNSNENAAPRFTASGLGLVYAANLEAVFGDCSASDLSLDFVGVAPSPLLAGRRFTETVRVSNLGPGWMRGVVLTATVPSGAYDGRGFVPQGSCASVTGSDPVVCTLGTLQKNDVLTATFDYRVVLTQELPLTNRIIADSQTIERYAPNNVVTPSATVDGPADLKLAVYGTPTSVVAGDLLTYTYIFTNIGVLPSNGGVFTATFSPDVTLLDYPSAPTCDLDAQNRMVCRFDRVAPNASVRYVVNTRVSFLTRSLITNTAVVKGIFDVDPSNDSTSVNTPDSASADLTLSMQTPTTTLYVNDVVTFNVWVTNSGPSAALDVLVSQSLPAGLTWNDGEISSGTGCQVFGADMRCQIGTLMPNVPTTATFTATLMSELGAQRITSAAVTTSDVDPLLGDNSATLNLLLNPIDLELTHQDLITDVRAGELLTYTLWVRNLNTIGNATQVQLTDTLPISTALLSASPGCSALLQTLRCSLSGLLPQAAQTFTMVVRVDPLYRGGALVNNSVVSSNQIEAIDASNNASSATTTVRAQVALRVSQSVGLTDLYTGSLANIAVVITNGGPSAATGLVLTDALPSQLRLVSATGAVCIGSTGAVRCNVGTLAVGGQALVTLTVAAQNERGAVVAHQISVAASEPEINLADNTAALNLRLNPIDLAIVQSVPAPVVAGTRLTYTLAISNFNALGSATQVRVTETLPVGVSYVSASPGCSSASGRVLCLTGSLSPSTGTAITIVVNVLDTIRNSLVSTATVGSDQLETSVSDNTHVLITPVDAQVDLAVYQQLSRDLLFDTEQFALTMVVTNLGPSLATQVQVTESLPVGLNMTGYSATSGVTCIGSSTVACSAPALGTNATLTAILQVQVSSSRIDQVPFVMSASALEPETDANNNQQTVTATMNHLDLAIAHLSLPSAAVAGMPITYTLRVTNLNTLGTATQVRLTDTLPTGVAYVAGASGCAATAGVVTCTLSSLAPLAWRDVVITGTIDPSVRGLITNSVQVGSAQFDPVPGNNISDGVVQVGGAFDLRVQQALLRSQLFDGDLITLVLTVTNAGPSAATTVQLTETLPTGLSAISYASTASVTCGLAPLVCGTSVMLPGQTLTVSIGVSVNTTYVGDVPMTVDVAADEPDSAMGNNSHTVTATLNILDISVSQTVSTPVAAGQLLTYTLIVSNLHSSGSATQIVLTDVVPFSTSVVSISSGCASALPQVICTLGNILPGSTTTATIVLLVDAEARGSLTNTVTAAGAQYDPATANNTSVRVSSVQANADLQVQQQTLAENRLFADDVVSLTVWVTNTGPAAATGVYLTTTLPAGLQIANAVIDPGITCAGSPLVCNGFGLSAGQATSVTLGLTVTNGAAGTRTIMLATAALEIDPITSNNQQTQTVILNVLDLAVAHVAAPSTVQAGTEMTYSLGVTHLNSIGSATQVILTDTLPAGVRVLALSSGCVINAGKVVCAMSDLAPGTGTQIDVRVWVSDTTRGTLTNTAIVGSAQLDTVSANNTTTGTTSVQANVDLDLSVELTQTLLFAGDRPQMMITLTNTSSAAATGIKVTTTLPGGLTLAGYSGAGVICVGSPVVCSYVSLGGGASLTTQLQLSTTTAGVGSVVISSVARATETDTDLANNSGAITIVLNQIDLAVEHINIDPYFLVNEAVTYTLFVTNPNSAGTATSVILTDTLPARIGYGGSSPGCTRNGQNVVCALGNLPPTTTRVVTVTGSVQPGGGGGNGPTTITNTAVVRGAQFDPFLSNNTTLAVSGIRTADLVLTQTLSSATLFAGDLTTMNITATNIGTGNANGVRLTATLPSGLSVVSYMSGGLTCNPVAPTQSVICTKDPLIAGATVTLSLRISVTGAIQGTRSITGEISTTTSEFSGINNTQVSTITANVLDLMAQYDPNPPAIAGTPITTTIRMTNLNSIGNATQITLVNTMPVTTVLSVSPGCSVVAATTTCLSASLAPGASVAFTVVQQIDAFANPAVLYVNTATVASAQLDSNPSNNTTTVTSTIAQLADTQLVSSLAQTLLMTGDAATLPVTVTNAGPSGATGTTLTITTPTGLNATVESQTTGVSCAGNPIVCTLPTLLVNQSVTVSLAISPQVSSSGVVSIAISTQAAQLDPNAANNTQTISVTLNQADLALGISNVMTSAVAGAPLTFTWRITNLNAAGLATQVGLTDTFVGGMRFVTGTPGCLGDDAKVSCTLGDLAAQASRDISVTFAVSVTTRDVLTSSVVLGAAQVDPNLVDNSYTLTTPVTAVTVLTGTISLAPAPSAMTTTELLTYTFVVSNLGPSSATNVVLTGSLTTTTSLSFYTPALCTSPLLAQFVCPLGALGPNVSSTLQITAAVNQVVTATLDSQATISATEGPTNSTLPAIVIHSQ